MPSLGGVRVHFQLKRIAAAGLQECSRRVVVCHLNSRRLIVRLQLILQKRSTEHLDILLIVPSQRLLETGTRMRCKKAHARPGNRVEFGGDGEDPTKSGIRELDFGGGELTGALVLPWDR